MHATALALTLTLAVPAALSAMDPAAMAASAQAEARKVPGKDKNYVELIGTVLGGVAVEVCGVPVTQVVLRVGGAPLVANCAGGVMANTCGRFREGQRVRLRGQLVLVPDVTAPGFVACDPATWQLLPLATFTATKSLK